jgi:hypothetical protein
MASNSKGVSNTSEREPELTKKARVEDVQVQIQFVDADGQNVGSEIDTPGSITTEGLQSILNQFLGTDEPQLLFIAD